MKKSGNQRKDKNKMKKELAKTYSPKDFEDRLYHEWEEKKWNDIANTAGRSSRRRGI
jgi:hypothetical protein